MCAEWREGCKGCPVDCLRVNDSDIADAEYVTEWLGIVLCRICGQQDVSMPPFEAGATPWHNSAGLSRKRPGRPVRSDELSFGAGYPRLCLPRKHGKASDSAETFLGSFLSENVYRERRRMQ